MHLFLLISRPFHVDCNQCWVGILHPQQYISLKLTVHSLPPSPPSFFQLPFSSSLSYSDILVISWLTTFFFATNILSSVKCPSPVPQKLENIAVVVLSLVSCCIPQQARVYFDWMQLSFADTKKYHSKCNKNAN